MYLKVGAQSERDDSSAEHSEPLAPHACRLPVRRGRRLVCLARGHALQRADVELEHIAVDRHRIADAHHELHVQRAFDDALLLQPRGLIGIYEGSGTQEAWVEQGGPAWEASNELFEAGRVIHDSASTGSPLRNASTMHR